ncbi:unnamed protein product [Callosobruchus maculatus]|uniref:Uncharacterized protein n=1 Tax=Callosobruchus maculatus TaxID=64391 RepID=A0A653DV96_CALMS|nr:unnamed protein product [Callosobruchus maculatus]
MTTYHCSMSPTEFSNYIKQRAMQQQLHQQQQQQQQVVAAAAAAAQAAVAASHPHQQQHSPAGRALSPDPSAAYYFPLGHHYPPPFPPRAAAGFDSSPLLPFEPSPPFYPGAGMGGPHPTPNGPQAGGQVPSGGQDKLDNNWPYSGQYQHLLVAN